MIGIYSIKQIYLLKYNENASSQSTPVPGYCFIVVLFYHRWRQSFSLQYPAATADNTLRNARAHCRVVVGEKIERRQIH